jgi:hypothetical protein
MKWVTKDVMLMTMDDQEEVRALAKGTRCFGPLSVHPGMLTLKKPRKDPLSWFVEAEHPPNRRVFQVTFAPTGRRIALFSTKDAAHRFCETLQREFQQMLSEVSRPTLTYDKALKQLTEHPTWPRFAARITALKEQP